MKKVKTYCLMLSRTYPSSHPRAGQPTYFKVKMNAALNDMPCYLRKLHTIRANYELWRKRFEKIAAGKAVLSIREWVGRPYAKGSTQRELALLTREDGIGIQKVMLNCCTGVNIETGYEGVYSEVSIEGCCYMGRYVPSYRLANNDGLSLEDWDGWFKGCDLSEPFAIIHFTKFRY